MNNHKNKKPSLEKKILINQEILSENVLLITEDENNKQTSKIVSTKFAIDLALQNELELVCVSPKANPPVCKILNFNKLNYYNNKKKVKKEAEQKEIRVNFGIQQHDLFIKLQKLIKIITKDKTTVKLVFYTRFKNKKQSLLDEEINKTLNYIKTESEGKIDLIFPIKEDKNKTIMFFSKKNK